LSGAFELRNRLLESYAAPSRSYHDTRHLREVLARVDELATHGTVFDRLPVELAAWFHDAVYDGRPDAEERSATWAQRSLDGVVAPHVVAEVARLVRLTETHRPDDDDSNGCALSDADLAILAAPAQRYAEYLTSVRTEYAHVSDTDFRNGRAHVLRGLVEKPHLFHTAYARGNWETLARANLDHELTTSLGAPPTMRNDVRNDVRNDIRNYADRVHPVGVLYVDVYPYRMLDDDTVEFLLLRRRTDVVMPDCWQAVSGKLPADERISHAFVRQVLAKTGQAPTRLHRLEAVTSFYDEYYDTVMLVPGAAAQLGTSDVRIDTSLHQESRWVTPARAHQLLSWPNARAAIDAIAEAVLGGGTAIMLMTMPQLDG
jgi:predicted metal-dependent HD superfamily phosphohydrolase/ADP-ribose pyrophosphatase YjhB (NUDIX family)